MKSSEKKGILILILVSIVIIAVIYGVTHGSKNENKKKKSTLKCFIWRDGRVVDCTGLENRHGASHLGFESLSLRH